MSSIEIAAIPSIFFAGIIGCYVPFLTRQLESGLQQAILTRGNAFAAGGLSLDPFLYVSHYTVAFLTSLFRLRLFLK